MASPNLRRAASACAFLVLASDPAEALTFIFNNVGGTTPESFMTAAAAAGNLWSGFFTDSITININIEYDLGGSTVANSITPASTLPYSTVRTALVGDAASSDDLSATSFLQAGPSQIFLINRTTSGSLRMDTGTAGTSADNNNTQLVVHRSLAKALGLVSGTDAGLDGTIELNPGLSYDADRSDGISASSYDLIGVIAHELGHVLGFQSVAELISGPAGGLTAEGSAIPRIADLFRFSSDSINPSGTFGGAGATTGVFDISGDTRAKYFSVDGGTTAVGSLALGSGTAASGFGNEQQANHWLNGTPPTGIMDPTIALGELLSITEADRRMLDVLGFNPVPESGTWAAGAVLGLGVWILRRRSGHAA